MSARYAIYLAPPSGSKLEEFATAWLGRDHVTGGMRPRLPVDGMTPERLAEITKSPRHYGFHATMKAPFVLAPGRTLSELEEAAQSFAASRSSFELYLRPGDLKGFLALLPISENQQLNQLASDCVRAFEPFRAALSDADITRRRRAVLTSRQDAQMLRWGYPYIFDDFHFHMTLTNRLQQPERNQVLAILQNTLTDILAGPFRVSEIAIYGQSSRDEPFCLQSRFELSA